MSTFHKILFTTLSLSYMALASVCVYGQSKIAHGTTQKHRNNLTIGFQSGRELLFNSSPLLHSRQSKIHYAISSTLVLRKSINQHFKIESGLKYNVVQNTINNTADKNFNSKFIGNQKNPFTASLPFTIQYYFLPEKSRIRPYIGSGLQYNFNTSGNNISPFTGDGRNDINPAPSLAGTKYINILFTQGMTFEINTKIQISESFHFIPGSTNKTIGIDLGIGYKLP